MKKTKENYIEFKFDHKKHLMEALGIKLERAKELAKIHSHMCVDSQVNGHFLNSKFLEEILNNNELDIVEKCLICLIQDKKEFEEIEKLGNISVESISNIPEKVKKDLCRALKDFLEENKD